jgi:hypothetical protein
MSQLGHERQVSGRANLFRFTPTSGRRSGHRHLGAMGQLPTCATRAQRTDPIALEKLVLSDAPWGTIVAGRAMQTARLIETGKSP